MDGEVYIYPHHGIPHRGVVDPPRTTTLRLRQPTVRTVLGSRIPRLPISFTPRFSPPPPSRTLLAPQPSPPSTPTARYLSPLDPLATVTFHFPSRFLSLDAEPHRFSYRRTINRDLLHPRAGGGRRAESESGRPSIDDEPISNRSEHVETIINS